MEINQKYGGLSPQVRNILFVNGANDPNMELQIREPLNNRMIVLNIEGVAYIILLYKLH